MKLLFQGLSAMLLAGSVVGAPTLEVALQAWREGDRSAAIATWHTLATRGNAEASLFLGYVYRNGLGVACDATRAAEWYRRAARLDQPEARYELVLMYELGIGVARDPAEAALWYGLPSAQACPSELAAAGAAGGPLACANCRAVRFSSLRHATCRAAPAETVSGTARPTRIA